MVLNVMYYFLIRGKEVIKVRQLPETGGLREPCPTNRRTGVINQTIWGRKKREEVGG